MENDISGKQQTAGVAILISYEKDFKTTNIIRGREGHWKWQKQSPRRYNSSKHVCT